LKTKFILLAALGLASLNSWADTIPHDIHTDVIMGGTLTLTETASGSDMPLISIPEPSSIILMGLVGFAAVLVLRNHKT